MKKVLLFSAAIVLTALSASAQISKGSSFLGGAFNFSNNKRTATTVTSVEEKKTSFQVTPSVGFAYKENRVWGLSLSYFRDRSAHADAEPEVKNSYGGGAFLRQYKPLGKGFYLFAEESLGMLYGKSDYTSDNTTASYKNFTTSLSFAPGFAYDISRRLQLELTLNNLFYTKYQHTDSKIIAMGSPEQHNKINDFSLGSNLNGLLESNSISIGGRFVFGR